MTGPTVAHLVNQLRADAHAPGTAPAVALAAAEALEAQERALRRIEAFSKVSWGHPVMADAARRVGDILRQERTDAGLD